MTAQRNNDYGNTCDRCGTVGYPYGPIVEVRSALPCCPVPLCDYCAIVHIKETADGVT